MLISKYDMNKIINYKLLPYSKVQGHCVMREVVAKLLLIEIQ